MFREIGLADELGSGMRNTCKYTRLYSGGQPQFTEGDVFRTMIPLSEANAAMFVVTPPNPGAGATPQVTPQVGLSKEENLLLFCAVPRSQTEIIDFLGLSDRKHFRKAYLKPLLESGKLIMTIPDKPNSRNQKYVKA